MTLKQHIEFAIEEWMKTKDPRRKKLILFWSEEIPELTDRILKEVKKEIKE